MYAVERYRKQTELMVAREQAALSERMDQVIEMVSDATPVVKATVERAQEPAMSPPQHCSQIKKMLE
jgi:hypothetical protein